jgi:4-hydroxy 2-oxovalerate aldolase
MISKNIKSKNKIKVLDCTLRDGGYYNNWDFNVELANQHLFAMHESGVDIVEIGFRSLFNNSYKGPFAYCKDKFLEEINCRNVEIAVMVNSKEFLESDNIKEKIHKLFPQNKINSKVDIVRFACNLNDIEKIEKASLYLNEIGYKVCINLIHGALLDEKNLLRISNQLKNIDLAAIYIADTTGSMDTIEYNHKLGFLKNQINCEVGIHAHNNIGQALLNTMNSIEVGCSWLDATILGMGRGPGNADIEELLISLMPNYRDDLNLIPIINHANKWFIELKEKYEWGKNRYYFLSGKHKIHPSYIQEMLSDSRYSSAEIVGAIDYLKNDENRIYNSKTLLKARAFFKGEPRGKNNPKEQINKDDILLIGNGKKVKDHKSNLESLIRDNNIYVIGINSISNINPELIDARVFCHPMRLLADSGLFQSINQLIITPFSMLPDKLKNKLKQNKVLDYGMKIEEGMMKSLEKYCVIPYPIALAYALCVIGSTKPKNIILAGFDGYPKGDERNNEVENIFKIFESKNKKVNLFSITPTNYSSIKSKSLYGLNI